jgi:tRNA A-37 threonylcarbamoyl transferase component Bud32
VIGQRVKDFTLVERLGGGGMGEVFVGEHGLVGTRTAVKVLRAELSADRTQVERFFNEARASSAIDHAGVVKVFDVGFMDDGRAYLVMELVKGESLAARLARLGKLPVADAAEIGRQIAGVLDAAHAAGIVHRDLKPDNIFLAPDSELAGAERAKVLDFGIAKLAGSDAKTAAGTMMGTPAYMAPELWTDASTASGATDVYALGCMLYELVCGRPPFRASSLAEACKAHVDAPPPHASEAGAPAALDALIVRMLAKSPAARPTPKQVAAELATLATGTRAAIAVDHAAPARSRWPVVGVVAVAAAAGIAVWATRDGGDHDDRTPATASRPLVPAMAPHTHVDPPPDTEDLPITLPGSAAVVQASGLVLSYRVLSQPTADAPLVAVAPDQALPTGTRMVFEVQLSEPAYLVVAQHRAGDAAPTVLFPDAQIALDKHLPAGTWVRVPPAPLAYQLDAHDVGRETVFLVASRHELHDLAAAVTAQAKHPAAAAQVGDQLVQIAMVGRDDCAGNARRLTLDTTGGCAVKTRGLVLAGPPPSADKPGAQAVRGLAVEDPVLVPFRFEHVAAPR